MKVGILECGKLIHGSESYVNLNILPTFLRLETQILNPDKKISNRTNCVQISHTASQQPNVYFKAKKLEIETKLFELLIFQFIVDFLVGNVSKSQSVGQPYFLSLVPLVPDTAS